MQAIGGYFELADRESGRGFPHMEGILLNTGRNALEYILRSIRRIRCIYLPYYTCEVILEPLRKLQIPWHFYHINTHFEIENDIRLGDCEYLIVNNYFGLKDAYIRTLADRYGDRLIVDCAQAFFASPISGIKSFYSARKYVGVADGGVAYLGSEEDGRVEVTETERTTEHDSHLYIRKQFGAEAGFAAYQENEKRLDNLPIRWMSDATKGCLKQIDYFKIVEKRRENYASLHNALKEKNLLELPALESFVCPMVYPFILRICIDLRKELIDNKLFVAKYWPNVHQLRTFETEFDLAQRIVAIPCDQRYAKDEMDYIIKLIRRYE